MGKKSPVVYAVFSPCGCRKRAHKTRAGYYAINLADAVLGAGGPYGVRCPCCGELASSCRFEYPVDADSPWATITTCAVEGL